jgi:hypothetical protein
LLPVLSCNIKTNCGVHHPVTRSLLCPGLDWNDAKFVFILMSLYPYCYS